MNILVSSDTENHTPILVSAETKNYTCVSVSTATEKVYPLVLMRNYSRTNHYRNLSVVSNRRVKIKRYPCPFCKDNRNHKPPSFTTSWSAIWHLSHHHKNETDFDKELNELKRLAKINHLALVEQL